MAEWLIAHALDFVMIYLLGVIAVYAHACYYKLHTISTQLEIQTPRQRETDHYWGDGPTKPIENKEL